MIRVFPDSDALARGAADHIASLAASAVENRNRCRLVLSGGETPRRAYTMLASPEFAERVDWRRIEVFWGDERCVPPDDARSNYRMARETLLDRLPIPAVNIHRIRGEAAPAVAAEEYERLVRGVALDLVLLGLGPDGHTASLFPGQAAVRESAAWVRAEYVSALGTWRVTLTPPAINSARAVSFLVSGAEKAATLEQVLEGSLAPDRLPARAIHPSSGHMTWLVDAAAASRLRHRVGTEA